MGAAPALTRCDRAQRHQRIVADYQAGHSSRAVAAMHGMNDSHVRSIVRLYEVARPTGWLDAPRDAAGRYAPKWVKMAGIHVGLPESGAVTECRPNEAEAA